MTLRLISTSVFSTFDLIMTMILVSMFGIGIELNPIGVALFSNITRHYPISKFGSWIVFIVYGGLTLWHLMGIALLI